MRCLCSIHIFSEKAEDVFTNNAISASLVDNEPLRAYILLLYVTIIYLIARKATANPLSLVVDWISTAAQTIYQNI